MMGFRDPNDARVLAEFEAERKDEFILEFGLAAYIEEFYTRQEAENNDDPK